MTLRDEGCQRPLERPGGVEIRQTLEPFNALATGVFLLAILHTFATARFAAPSTDSARAPLDRPASCAPSATRRTPPPPASAAGPRPRGSCRPVRPHQAGSGAGCDR